MAMAYQCIWGNEQPHCMAIYLWFRTHTTLNPFAGMETDLSLQYFLLKVFTLKSVLM